LDCGNVVLVACVSPYIHDRERARQIIGSAKFREIYISCPMAVCQERDPKGFYKRNISRELTGLTGYDDPYQPPISPDLTLDTARLSLEDEIEKLMAVVDRSLTFSYALLLETDQMALNGQKSAASTFSS
jgi:adenylylsulfate kinase